MLLPLVAFAHTRGPQSFTQLKTIEGDLCSFFREACFRLGLLEDDNQYHLVMQGHRLATQLQVLVLCLQ